MFNAEIEAGACAPEKWFHSWPPIVLVGGIAGMGNSCSFYTALFEAVLTSSSSPVPALDTGDIEVRVERSINGREVALFVVSNLNGETFSAARPVGALPSTLEAMLGEHSALGGRVYFVINGRYRQCSMASFESVIFSAMSGDMRLQVMRMGFDASRLVRPRVPAIFGLISGLSSIARNLFARGRAKQEG